MKSWLIIAVKVDADIVKSLDSAGILVGLLEHSIFNEVTVLNTITAGE